MTLAEDVLKRHAPHVLARDECQECEAIQPRSRQCDAYRLAVMVRDIEALRDDFATMHGAPNAIMHMGIMADRLTRILDRAAITKGDVT